MKWLIKYFARCLLLYGHLGSHLKLQPKVPGLGSNPKIQRYIVEGARDGAATPHFHTGRFDAGRAVY